MPNLKKELINKYIEAWYFRTLKAIDLDNGGKTIEPPTKEEWEAGVREDLERLFTRLSAEKDREWKEKINDALNAEWSKQTNVGIQVGITRAQEVIADITTSKQKKGKDI